jgi:hypothetical protein
MALTRVSPALFQVSNNITSVTVGGSANTISLTFDSNGVITGASNNAVSVANTAITGNIISSQIASVNGSVITANTIANSAIQTGAVENYMRGASLDFGMRNRIINGAMVIDQRNAGASYTQVNGLYNLDRWAGNTYDGGAATNKFSVIQSSTAPTGFSKSLLVTSLAATSSAASNIFNIEHKIEGFNFADFLYGTASAQTLTLSFWVRSSLTGTFGGALKNSARDRAYPFTYTISTANTFEQKTITITGDTSGTWVGGTNGIGLWISFGLGVGSTYSGTAGAWGAGDIFSATGATSVVGTNGATFYITGVQLEKGSTATSFDYRPYGTELALCQRYYQKVTNAYLGLTFNVASLNYGGLPLKVTMRAAPTLDSGASYSVASGSAGTPAFQNAGTYNSTTADVIQLYNSASNWTGSAHCAVSAGFNAEL